MTTGLGQEGLFATTVAEAVAFTRQGLSVHVVGPHGSGRSELLGLVASRLEDEGWRILRLFGNPAWRNEPFAALISASPGLAAPITGGPAASPRRTVSEMTTALQELLRSGRTAVIVDDADELDLGTIGALVASHHQRRLVAVTTSRAEIPTRPDSLVVGLSPCVQLRPPVLDVDEVHAVCRDLLGGPVEVGTLARITTQSGGLTGLVRAIVTIGRETGILERRDDVWHATGLLWTPHLGAVMERYLAGVELELRDAATVLAVSGPVPVEDAERRLDRRRLDRLFTAGLIHVSGGVVGIFPPLVAEYLKREGSPFDAVDIPAGSPAVLPSAAVSRAVGPDAAVRNQRLFSRAASDVVRLQLAWEERPSVRSAMPLLVALRASARTAEDIEYIISATPSEDSFEDARLRSWHATWLAVDQGRLAEALTVLDAATDRMPHQRGLLDVTRAHVGFMRDRVPSIETLERGPESDDAELLLVLRVELLLGAGLTEQARRLLDGFHPTGRVASAQALLLGALAAVLDGDIDIGVVRARRGYAKAIGVRDPALQQAQTYTAVLGLGLGGRLLDATKLLFDALSASTVAYYRDVYHTGILVLGATIAIAQGRTEYAAALAAQARTADSGRGPYPGMDPRVLDARLERSSLWPIVEDRLDRGYLSAAIFLAIDAAELEPDAERGRRIRAIGASMEGALLPALAQQAYATALEDEPGLLTAAQALATTGAQLYVVRADVTRCLLLRRAGRAEEAVQLAQQAWERSAVGGLERAGLFARLQDDVALTTRELEILQLLASPMSTQDVARHQQMSVRTVETHVHNASRKLGGGGREALLRAVTSWLEPSAG